jgi:protein-arginine kinase activator protein McsA
MIFLSPEDAERHVAESDAVRHEFTRFLNELHDDGLRMIETMLDGMATSDHPARMAAFFSGKIGQIRETRFNICTACGKNHDKDLEELVGDGNKKDMPEPPPHVAARRKLDEAAEDSNAQPLWTPLGSTAPMSEGELNRMAMFKLDDLRMEDTNELLAFVCLGCGMRYSSIQDRILKPMGVEGCSGCQQKAKFG